MTAPVVAPQPIATAETARYWGAALAGRLEIQHCRACARHQFYPRPFCTRCLSNEIEWVAASGRGRVYTYTVCHVAAHPAFEARVPYAIAMIELDEGVRMLAGVVDTELDRLRIDVPVEVCFERLGEFALPMFRLAPADARPSARTPS